MIYKVFRPPEWRQLQSEGRTDGAPVDLSDGFIHFSTAAQLPETLAKHFAGEDELILVAVEDAALADALKWEPSRGGALFPHLYRALTTRDVAADWRLARGPDGRHILPETLP